jgi:hypothetical protein
MLKERRQPMDKTCLSYWFPLLRDAGLLVPRTEIIDAGEEWHEMTGVLDGGDEKSMKPFNKVVTAIRQAAEKIGYPVFLRTGQGSGKHSWKDTCYLTDAALVPQHVFNLIEWSAMVDMMGLPYRYWCVREMLPTIPHGICPRYGNMPVCKEFRFFAGSTNDGLGYVKCAHPYWPHESLVQGGFDMPASLYDMLCYMTNQPLLYAMARKSASVIGGEWSIDFLETERGWYLTDCAEAAKSFHWPGCDKAPK